MNRKDVKNALRDIESLMAQTHAINKKVQELKAGLGPKEAAVAALDLGSKGRAAVGTDGSLHVQAILDTDEEIKKLIAFLSDNLEDKNA